MNATTDAGCRAAARGLNDGTLRPEEFLAWLSDDACKRLRELIVERVGIDQKTADRLVELARELREVRAPLEAPAGFLVCPEHDEQYRADRLCSRCVREDVRLTMGSNSGA